LNVEHPGRTLHVEGITGSVAPKSGSVARKAAYQKIASIRSPRRLPDRDAPTFTVIQRTSVMTRSTIERELF